MNVLSLKAFVLTVCVLTKITFGFRVKHADAEFEYRITDIKQCSVSGTIIGQFISIALDQCVYHCVKKSNCEAVNYQRRYPLCELRSQGNDVGEADKIKGCVTVLRSDITVLKLDTNTEAESPYSSQECSKFQLENGHVKGNMYEVGSKLEIECDVDYQEASNMYQITCLPNGSWSHDPICEKAIVCSEPPEQENSVLSDGGTTLNLKRTYTCKEGYSTGNETVTMVTSCNDQGQWTPTNFTCYKAIVCSEPPEKENSILSDGRTTLNSKRTYTCKNGYSTGNETVTMVTSCNKQGQWTPTNFTCYKGCGEPGKKDNAHVLPGTTHEASKRTYECDVGFDVRHDSYMITRCDNNGMWSLTNFECVVDCGTIPNIPNTKAYDTLRTVLGSSVKYNCKEGYELVGAFNTPPVRIECLENGNWSYTNTWSCEKKRTIGRDCWSTDCMETNAVCVKTNGNAVCFCDHLSRYNKTLRDCIKVCDSLTEGFDFVPSERSYRKFMKRNDQVSGEAACRNQCRLNDTCMSYALDWSNERCFLSQVTYDMITDVFPKQEEYEHYFTYSRRCVKL